MRFFRRLPGWARAGKDGYIEVYPSRAYSYFLTLLGPHGADLDQYWLEVCRRCFVSYLRDNFKKKGELLRVRILRDDQWKLSNFPAGNGAEAGAAEFAQYYDLIKGNIK